MNKKIKLNLWKLYGYGFFNGLIFTYAIEKLFALERGITIEQIVILEIICVVTALVLEIPTGALSDKWGRKNVMLLSSFFYFLFFFILIFSYDFLFFAIANIFYSLALVLSSGTKNSLVYELLKEINEQHTFQKRITVMYALDNVSYFLAVLFGAFIAQKVNFTFTYWLTLFSTIIALLFILSINEPKKISSRKNHKLPYWEHIKQSYLLIKTSDSLMFILGFGIVIQTIVYSIWEYYQLYLEEMNTSLLYFGIIPAALALGASVGNLLSDKLKEIFGYKKVFTFIIFIGSLGMILTGSNKNIFGIIALVLSMIVLSLYEVLVYGYLHSNIDASKLKQKTSHRATVESFQSFAFQITAIITSSILVFILKYFHMSEGFKFLGLAGIAYGIYFYFAKNKYLREHPTTHYVESQNMSKNA